MTAVELAAGREYGLVATPQTDGSYLIDYHCPAGEIELTVGRQRDAVRFACRLMALVQQEFARG